MSNVFGDDELQARADAAQEEWFEQKREEEHAAEIQKLRAHIEALEDRYSELLGELNQIISKAFNR